MHLYLRIVSQQLEFPVFLYIERVVKEKNPSNIETKQLIFFIEPCVVLGVMNLCIVVVHGLTLLCCYLSNELIVLYCVVTSHGLMVLCFLQWLRSNRGDTTVLGPAVRTAPTATSAKSCANHILSHNERSNLWTKVSVLYEPGL